MREALLGGALGLVTGALSVYSLWLIVGFTAQASKGLSIPEEVERPSGWDVEAQDPDVVTSGQWFRKRQETVLPPSSAIPDDNKETWRATLRIFFAFLLKAPILFAIALVARSLGTTSLHWCVGGVILVYCSAVFWAVARTDQR